MQEGGKEANPRAGWSRGAPQRPTAPPLNGACDKPPAPPARWPPRARTTQQERAQPERASGRTWQWGALSHVQRGASRCTNAPNSAASASRAPPAASCATRIARHDPRATPARARPRVRSCVRACSCAIRRARWRGAPSLPTLVARPRVTRAWRAAKEEARDTAAHTPPPRVRARGPAAAA